MTGPISDPEVIVAGGGAVGATLALALARAGMAVTVVDAEGPEAVADPRASAVAASAVRMWEALGVGREALGEAQAITAMAVAEGSAPSASAPRWGLAAALRFEGAPEGDGDDIGGGPLGWMVPNAALRAALREAATAAGATWLSGARLANLEVAGPVVEARLADGRTLRAPLVVGGEGRRSAVREAAGIGLSGWRYGQEGVVATVQLSRPHGGVARQLFLPDGPLAVLPLAGDRASLVWSTSSARARALVEGSAEAFEAMLARTLGDGIGTGRLVGPRARFPLELRLAQAMVGARTALAGDAAQVIHPVAGQGLNLGLKDAAALAETLVEARRLGEDWGGDAVLARYARWRRFDRLAFAAGTDAFVRAFSTASPLARLARGAAFAVAGASAPLRRAAMREAGGLLGDPPRLLRGQAL